MAQRKRLNQPNVQQIETLRLNLKLTPAALADKAGIERKILYAWYREGATATTKNIVKVATALGVTPASITINSLPILLPDKDEFLGLKTGYMSEFSFNMSLEGMVFEPAQNIEMMEAVTNLMRSIDKITHRKHTLKHDYNVRGNTFDEIIALNMHSLPDSLLYSCLIITIRLGDFVNFIQKWQYFGKPSGNLKAIDVLHEGNVDPSAETYQKITTKYKVFDLLWERCPPEEDKKNLP